MGAIGLNPIRLDRIGLDPIRINAIKLGVPGAASGTDRPYIDPEVLASLKAVCICYGKSNDDPDRAIVKNLVDPDNPFVISNAAYEGMSGYNGYPIILSGTNRTYQDKASYVNVVGDDKNVINLTRISFNTATIFSYVKQNGALTSYNKDIESFKIKVTGIDYSRFFIKYSYISEANATAKTTMTIASDSIYELPKSFTSDGSLTSNDVWIGFSFTKQSGDIPDVIEDVNVTIEVISEYTGALVTDGVNDLITSTKTVQEMLGGSNKITVVSMIHQVKDSDNNVSFTNYIRGSANGYFRNIVNNYDKTGIYGYTSSDLMGLSVVNNILGDKNDYTSNGDNRDSIINGNFSVQGYSYNDGNNTGDFSSVAWYWTVIANKVLTTDQINQVIAYFNLDRTLKPDILCNTIKQGITNENHAEFGDKLIDFSGNGRDIQLNNLAWDGDSGIGKYNYPNWKVTATIANTYSTIVNYPTVNGTYSINVNGVSELMQSIGLHLEIKYTTSTGIIYNDIKQDGVYSYILPDGATDLTLRFGGIPGIVNEPCNITITQIPSHAGALYLDGVSDFGQFVGDLGLKDYTFIADRAYDRIVLEQAPFIASKSTNGQAPFLMEYLNSDNYVYPHSFGATTKTTNLNIQRQISYQSTYVYNGNSISKGTSVDTGDGLTIGNSGSTGAQYSPLCLWSLMLFPYSMSEFLIERQLKKHKLGTLYPDMVEFRPIVPKDDRIESINYYNENDRAYIGNYYPIGSNTSISFKMVKPYKITSIKVNGANTVYNHNNGFNFKMPSKSPQKFTNLNIVEDTSIVQWNPVITSTARLTTAPTFVIRGTTTLLKPGDWIPKNSEIWVIVTMNDLVDKLIKFSLNGTFIHIPSSSYNPDTGKYGFPFVIDNESTQNINLTIDEYIRFEDIVQPYPSLFTLIDYDTEEVYSWGSKLKVGTKFKGNVINLLPDMYEWQGNILYNGEVLDWRVNPGVVAKEMVFSWNMPFKYLIDNNEPKCILSPRILRMPNSSYKYLGYIPDISGHGNHGVIHNSAYAEGSGVNEDGSYQFDGVDDFVTIPTVTGGKQVLMKVNNNTINSMLYDQRSSGASPDSLYNDFAIYCTNTADNNQIAYQSRLVGNTYIDGILNTNITCEDLLGVLHNITITCDIVAPNNGVVPNIGGGGVFKDLYSNMALYDFMLFDNISTDDKIKELNEYVGIEAKVELPPYYWDAYGKTNLDADKATIQQRGIAVGDFDLTNYNHAYDKMSGYGGYAFAKFDNTSEWIYTNNSDTIEVVNRDGYDVVLRKVGNGTNYWHFRNTIIKSLGQDIQIGVYANKSVQIVWQLKYKLEGDTDYNTLAIASPTIEGNINTYVTLPYKTEQEIADLNAIDTYYSIYFIPIDLDINEEVTIEMLPLYPNGLVYDGVVDYSENVNIPALTDYTYVFKRELLNLDKVGGGASLYKGSFYSNGGRAFIVDINDKNPNSEMSGYSYGNRASTSTLKTNKIIYGTKTSVNGVSVTPGSNTDNASLTLGKWDVNYKQMVFYKLILYPKTIPLLQINFLKNLMERDEIIDLNNPIFVQE